MKTVLVILFLLLSFSLLSQTSDSTTFNRFGFQLSDTTSLQEDSTLIVLPKYVLVEAAKDIVRYEALLKEAARLENINKVYVQIVNQKNEQIQDFMKITESYERSLGEYEEIELFNENAIEQLKRDNRNLRIKNTAITGVAGTFLATSIYLFVKGL